MFKIKKSVIWFLIIAVVAGAAGAAGISQAVNGNLPVAVSQAVLIDRDNFDANDVGKAASRANVSVNDEGTAASIGANLATGDTLVVDLPLVNMSDNDATVMLTMDIPEGLSEEAEVFWNTFTRYTTPTAQTTTPSPEPVTDTLPQSSDTTFSLATITGAAEIKEQSSNSEALLDTVQPDMSIVPAQTGLPNVTPQSLNGTEYTTQLPGSADINAQTVDAAYDSTHDKLDTTPSDGYWAAGPVLVDSSGDVGKYSSLAAKDEDVLYIGYSDASNERLLFKRSLNGGTTWEAAQTLYNDKVAAIAVAASGDSVFVAYWEAQAVTGGSTLYMSSSTDCGETWVRRTVTDINTTNTKIAISVVDDETVFVSYVTCVASYGTLMVARSTDAGDSFHDYDKSIVALGIPKVKGVTGAPAMSALSDGRVYCSYVKTVDIPVFPPLKISICVSSLYVASSLHVPSTPFSLTAWISSVPLMVVPTGFSIMYIPISVGFLADRVSLYALDNNHVFISYTYKPAWVLPTMLMFARSIPYTYGKVFSVSYPVDVPDFCAPYFVDVENSIKAFDSGTVLITYYNGWDGDLVLARSDNYGLPFTWDYTHLDGDGGNVPPYTNNDVGHHNSLITVDGSTEFTMVSYYDSDAGDLRFYAETPGDQNYYRDIFRVDWDADGELEDLYCLLTDLDDDGSIDRIDLSHDTTFGEGNLHDIQTWTDDDERIWAGSRSGTTQSDHLGKYWFYVYFQHDLNPGNTAYAAITSRSWFQNYFYLDLDVDATSDERVYFVLSDTNSNGLYDTLELSADDTVYGETITGLTSLTDKITGDDDDLNDDECSQQIASEENSYHALYENIRIGRYYTFNAAWDTNPGTDLAPDPTADVIDARFTALSRFVGELDFDIDADGSLTGGGGNIVNYTLSDRNSDGLYDAINYSSPDTVFAEGAADDDQLTSDPKNDEWIPATTIDPLSGHATIDLTTTTKEMWFGPNDWCWVRVAYDPNPPADLSDTTVLTLNRFTALPGWTIDADGDEVADNDVYFVLSDTNSNGDVDVMDVSIGDTVFGEGLVTGRTPPLEDGAVDYFATDNFNDERIAFADFPYILRLGLHYFAVEADTALLADDEDGFITSRWYVGTFLIDVDNDLEDNVIDFVQVDPDSDGVYTIFELDGDDSDSYDPSEVHDHSDVILDMIGHRVRLFFRQNPAVVHSAIIRDGEILNMVPAGNLQWLFVVPATAKPGQEQSQIRIVISVPPDAPPGYYKATFVLEQVE